MNITPRKVQQASFPPLLLNHQRIDDEGETPYQPRLQATSNQDHTTDANALDEAGNVNFVGSEFPSKYPADILIQTYAVNVTQVLSTSVLALRVVVGSYCVPGSENTNFSSSTSSAPFLVSSLIDFEF